MALRWQAPTDGKYTIAASSSKGVTLHLHEGTCAGKELGCQRVTDPTSLPHAPAPPIVLQLKKGQVLILFVDGADAMLTIQRAPNEAGLCANGLDDDGDGVIDCQNPDCKSFCTIPEDCGNGVDDDGNGLVDCGDLTCWPDPRCSTNVCPGVDLGSALSMGPMPVMPVEKL